MERRVIRFTGRVQGVGFRASAASIARRYPVTGWVRNEPDRSVMLEVQGQALEIESFLGDLRIAMRGNITAEEVAQAPLEDGDANFTIRH